MQLVFEIYGLPHCGKSILDTHAKVVSAQSLRRPGCTGQGAGDTVDEVLYIIEDLVVLNDLI